MKTGPRSIAGLMLVHRQPRWSNILTTLHLCLSVFRVVQFITGFITVHITMLVVG